MAGIEWLAPACTGAIAALYVAAFRRAQRELKALVTLVHGPLREPLVVVMPARNEAETIERTLEHLLADPSEHLSVLVWDDGSTDATAEIVKKRSGDDARLTLLQSDGSPLPAGVFGKPRALHLAVEWLARQGPLPERLLFLDADVIVSPGALGGLVEAARREKAHAVSGTPALDLGSFVEELLVPAFVSLVGERHRPSRVNGDAHAFLNGQCILVDTKAYQAVGGFGAVERTVLEDVAFASVLQQAGSRLRLADLRESIATRMYTSLGDIVSGFGKNARPVLGGRVALVRLAVLGMVLAWVPSLALASTVLRWWGEGMQVATVAPVATTAVFAAVIMACGAGVRRAMNGAAWPALVLPLVWAVVAFVLVRAAIVDRVNWKGRAYRAPES